MLHSSKAQLKGILLLFSAIYTIIIQSNITTYCIRPILPWKQQIIIYVLVSASVVPSHLVRKTIFNAELSYLTREGLAFAFLSYSAVS